MKRLLLLLTTIACLMWSSPAGAALQCYYARVSPADGGEPVLVVVCP